MRNKRLLLIIAVLIMFTGCNAKASKDSSQPVSQSPDYEMPEMSGRIETPEVKESSGLAASQCQQVLWTHNDAGSGPFIFGMTNEGKHLGTWRVNNAENIDWESIAGYKDPSGKCFLLIGDIGDNDETRSELAIYKIPEPGVSPSDSASTTAQPLQTAPAEVLKFKYSNGPHNAESLLVHQKTGEIYVLTKARSGPSEIHKLKPVFGAETAALTEKIDEISMPSTPAGLLTDGAFSPDGKRVMLCDKEKGYELILPEGAGTDVIWTQKPVVVNLGDRKQGEGVSYSAAGNSVYASSERKNAALFRIRRKKS